MAGRTVAARHGQYTDPGAIVSWLADHGGERCDPGVLIAGLCERMLAAGTALLRVSYGVPMRHPQVCGLQIIWRQDQAEVAVIRHRHGVARSCALLEGPTRMLDQGAAHVRRRLEGPSPELDGSLMHELSAEGATDYVALPLHFSSGEEGFISWASDRPGGFDDDDLVLFDRLLPLITLRLEIEASYYLSETLLETYLGRDAARRVLAGHVERGNGERVRAAILLSDLRGFTAMADRLPAETVIARLNDYFDVVARQVERYKGEVLEFIGDGMLCAFDIDGERHGAACCQALHAAIAALHRMAALNRRGDEPLRMVIALHLGDVVYGNIGAANRLDFTVIGPTVNEAARIEGLCKTLDRPLLASASFAESCTCEPLVSLGRHVLRGAAEPREIFTLPPNRLPTEDAD